jgi:hypothetical protein
MKTVLALLLCFILAEAPVLARDIYQIPGQSTNLVGAYAGVMIPIATTILVPSTANFGSNALGLFTLSIPTTGIGAGTLVLFTGADTFTGTIQALANPNPNNPGVLGVATATFNYSLYVTTTTNGTNTITTEAITATANGSFDANAVQDTSSVGGNGLDLSGTTQFLINQGFVNGSNGNPIETEQVTFDIEGFLQSTTAGG